jgi:type I restriction enzyme S subunit
VSELNRDLLATVGELADEPVEQTGPTGDFVYIDISSIDREAKKISDPKPLTLAQAPSRAKQVLKAGDVLVSMTRPNLNAVALVPEHLDGAIGSTGFHVLRSRWLSPGFLLALVQTQNFIDAMSDVVQGALYPAVRPRDIAAYSFSFETPAQQTRIVTKLEELLSDLDAGVAELKVAQKKLAQYRQSLLKAAVEGALTQAWRAQNPPIETGEQLLQRILQERRARWEAKQLAKFDSQGKAPPKDWQKKYPEPVQPDATDLPVLPPGWVWASVDMLSPDDLANGRSVPTAEAGAKVLRLTAVKDGRIDLRECKVGDWSEDDAKQFAVVEGDLLIVRGNGSLPLVGRAGLVANVDDQVAYPDTMIRLRVVDSVVSPSWVGLVWDSHCVRTHLERRARTSAGIYKIAQPDIVSAPVPVPGLTEQAHVRELFEQQLEQISAMQTTVEVGLKQSTAQRQNILRAAFSGQLVPQDPNDEPASALLDRIRAERAAREPQKKPRGRQAKEAV